MIKIKSERKWVLTGRGDVYVVQLKENNLPLLRKEWGRLLMNQKVEIDGNVLIVRAIEAFALADGCEHQSIGLLVK